MISKLQPFLQFRDNVVILITPAKDIDPNPTVEEEFEAVLDEDMYCIDDTDTINSVDDESRPLFRTVENVQLDTMKTYEQVKL